MMPHLRTLYNKYDPLISKWIIGHKSAITRVIYGIVLSLVLMGVLVITGYSERIALLSDISWAFFLKKMGSLSILLILLILSLSPIWALSRSRTILSLITLRRPLGILSAIAALIHGIGYIDMGSLGVFALGMSPLSLGIGAGSIGLTMMVILLLTSNDLSQRLLKKHWKSVQKLAYLALIFAVIHAVMMSREGALIILTLIYIGLKIAQIIQQNKKKHAS